MAGGFHGSLSNIARAEGTVIGSSAYLWRIIYGTSTVMTGASVVPGYVTLMV